MNNLHEEKCIPCRGSEAALTPEQIEEFRDDVPDWELVDPDSTPKLRRQFKVADFGAALELANRIGEAAEKADHHPRLIVEWGRVTVSWWTHAIDGLHRNDFIMAARTNHLANEAPQ